MPGRLVSHNRVEEDQQLVHGGDQGDLFGVAPGDQARVEDPDHGIGPGVGQQKPGLLVASGVEHNQGAGQRVPAEGRARPQLEHARTTPSQYPLTAVPAPAAPR